MATDLTREDLAAFVAVWPRTYVPFGLVTERTFRVLDALRELADHGGALVVHADVATVVLTEPKE